MLYRVGDEAVDVYNTFTWDEEDDKLKIEKALEKFKSFCNPRKTTIYESMFSRAIKVVVSP